MACFYKNFYEKIIKFEKDNSENKLGRMSFFNQLFDLKGEFRILAVTNSSLFIKEEKHNVYINISKLPNNKTEIRTTSMLLSPKSEDNENNIKDFFKSKEVAQKKLLKKISSQFFRSTINNMKIEEKNKYTINSSELMLGYEKKHAQYINEKVIDFDISKILLMISFYFQSNKILKENMTYELFDCLYECIPHSLKTCIDYSQLIPLQIFDVSSMLTLLTFKDKKLTDESKELLELNFKY